jgi:hypothetical protein
VYRGLVEEAAGRRRPRLAAQIIEEESRALAPGRMT